jgi:hypothetical protein
MFERKAQNLHLITMNTDRKRVEIFEIFISRNEITVLLKRNLPKKSPRYRGIFGTTVEY